MRPDHTAGGQSNQQEVMVDTTGQQDMRIRSGPAAGVAPIAVYAATPFNANTPASSKQPINPSGAEEKTDFKYFQRQVTHHSVLNTRLHGTSAGYDCIALFLRAPVNMTVVCTMTHAMRIAALLPSIHYMCIVVQPVVYFVVQSTKKVYLLFKELLVVPKIVKPCINCMQHLQSCCAAIQ